MAVDEAGHDEVIPRSEEPVERREAFEFLPVAQRGGGLALDDQGAIARTGVTSGSETSGSRGQGSAASGSPVILSSGACRPVSRCRKHQVDLLLGQPETELPGPFGEHGDGLHPLPQAHGDLDVRHVAAEDQPVDTDRSLIHTSSRTTHPRGPVLPQADLDMHIRLVDRDAEGFLARSRSATVPMMILRRGSPRPPSRRRWGARTLSGPAAG